MLHIRLFGDFQISYNGNVLSQITRARYKSLFAYMVIHGAAPQLRRTIAMFFWPESTESQAHTNLRNLIRTLRQNAPDLDAFLSISGEQIAWNPSIVRHFDVVEFQHALTQAEKSSSQTAIQSALMRAVELYEGELLPGSYDDWILVERDRLQNALFQALEQLSLIFENQRAYPQAIEQIRKLLRLDPLREEGYRRLMQLFALNQDFDNLRRAFQECRLMLARELDTEPSPLTMSLYEQLTTRSPMTPSRFFDANEPFTAPLVNRLAEWEQLESAWQQARRGRPHCILITGEAGLGKTRLVTEFMNAVSRRGYYAAYASAGTQELSSDLAPLIDWLRTGHWTNTIQALNSHWQREIARILPELLGHQSDLTAYHPLSQSWERRQLHEALARTFLDTNKPLLLVLDDLQWVDQETLHCLYFLLSYRSNARLLLVATLRPESRPTDHPLVPWQLMLQREHLLTALELSEFGEADSVQLVQALTNHTLLAAEKEQLFSATEGNPLFIVEAVRSAIQNETPRRFEPLNSQNIQVMLALRLNQLTPAAQHLLNVTAVAGHIFDAYIVTAASELDESETVSALDELVQRRIIRELNEEQYRFSYEALRVFAFNRLSRARQRHYQNRLAAAARQRNSAEP